MSAFTDFLGQVTGVTEIKDIAGPLVAFFATITDGKMWRSLGWLILGLFVMGIGINLWLHNPLGKAIGGAAKAGEVAAVL